MDVKSCFLGEKLPRGCYNMVHVIWMKTARSNVAFSRLQRSVKKKKKNIEMGELVDFFFLNATLGRFFYTKFFWKWNHNFDIRILK